LKYRLNAAYKASGMGHVQLNSCSGLSL